VPKTATIGFAYLLKLAADGTIGQAVEEESEGEKASYRIVITYNSMRQ
jgi:hypothetical protein